MTQEQAQDLPHGLYRIWWNDSPNATSSLAAVGSTHNGSRWYCPTNWIGGMPSTDWNKVECVVPIILSKY